MVDPLPFGSIFRVEYLPAPCRSNRQNASTYCRERWTCSFCVPCYSAPPTATKSPSTFGKPPRTCCKSSTGRSTLPYTGWNVKAGSRPGGKPPRTATGNSSITGSRQPGRSSSWPRNRTGRGWPRPPPAGWGPRRGRSHEQTRGRPGARASRPPGTGGRGTAGGGRVRGGVPLGRTARVRQCRADEGRRALGLGLDAAGTVRGRRALCAAHHAPEPRADCRGRAVPGVSNCAEITWSVRPWDNPVVPLAVKLRLLHVQPCHLLVWYFDACWIDLRIKAGLDT